MAQGDGGKLYEFLRRTAEDPGALEQFQADPEAAMEEAGLEEHHKHAVRSGDTAHVERVLKSEGLEQTAVMFCQALE